MKIEWLITNVTAAGFPVGAESVFWAILTFLTNSGRFCGRGATFVIYISLLEPLKPYL